MNSILNNSAALSALQSLTMTQQSLGKVQNEVSTGLSVATAADNSSYWSISQQLNSDSGMVTASNSALSEGQSVLSTATGAINSIITTLNSMATQLTEAQNPGASLTNVNTAVASLGAQLNDAVNGASFNGLNVLNGTQTAMTFVSGFNASATGGSVNTINFTAQALTGSVSQPTTTTSTINSASVIAALQGLTAAAGAPSVGVDQIIFSVVGAGKPDQLTVNSIDASGNTTSTVYTAETANGQAIINGAGFASDTGAGAGGAATTTTQVGVSTTYTPAIVPKTTTMTSTVTNAAQMTQLQAIETAHVAAVTASKVSTTVPTATYGADAYYYNAAAAQFTIQAKALDGTVTTSTYTALDANGNTKAQNANLTFAAGANGPSSFAVSTTVTANPTNLLVQGGNDLTQIGGAGATAVTASNAQTWLTSVNQALAAVQNYSGQIGATQDRMTAASTFNTALTTNYANGVAGLVDADMNTASTQLQALQTQEQLGIQSLSIANQNAALVLKLFA
jgi:flagellin